MIDPYIRSRPRGHAFFAELRRLYNLSITDALPIANGHEPLPSWEHVRALERMGARIPKREHTQRRKTDGTRHND